jgi:hypothetical protein
MLSVIAIDKDGMVSVNTKNCRKKKQHMDYCTSTCRLHQHHNHSPHGSMPQMPLKRLSQYEAFHLLHNESSIGVGSPNLMVDLEALMIWSLCSSNNKRDLERLCDDESVPKE